MKEPTLNSGSPGMTPGTLLKTVRQEKGLSVIDVAARLCLSAHYIEDIERDDFSQMSARAYARGYIMSYAHLLGIPQSKILPTLANVSMEFAPVKSLMELDQNRSSSISQPPESPHQRSNVLLWISIFVIIILIGLVVLWWRGPSTAPDKTNTNDSTMVPIQQPPQPAAPASKPAAPQQMPPASSQQAPVNAPSITAPSAATSKPVAPPQSVNSNQSVVQPSDLKESGELPPPRASSSSNDD